MSKYTFLLPAYKAAYLAEALESIKSQTNKDFKVIVSDDCSPEDIKLVYDNVCGDDPRFSYRRNKENMGGKSLASHWNLLVDMCESEYLIMASDDDVYEHNFLEEIDNLTEKYPNNDMFRAKIRYIDGDGKLLKSDPLVEEQLDRLHFLEHYYIGHILSCEACYCYRTSVVKEIGGYKDFPMAWFTDDAQHIQMSKNGVAITPNIIFSYRESELAISSNNDNSEKARKKIISAMMFCDWFLEYFKSIDGTDEPWLKKNVYKEVRRRIVEHINGLSCKLDWKDFLWLCKNLNGRLEISRPILFYWWWKLRNKRKTQNGV